MGSIILFLGLPVSATPNQVCQKKTKWRTELPEGFACPIPTSMGPIFAGRGRVILGLLADRFGSRFKTNTTILRDVIGPISTRNYLSKYSIR